MMHYNRLLSLLIHPRPTSDTEWLTLWFARALLPELQPKADAYGNFHLKVGDSSSVMFMAHTDTVDSRATGIKELVTDKAHSYLALDTNDMGNRGYVLGADDGAGCEILCCMVEAGVPGYYIWTANEERGCLGTNWMLENTPEVFTGITHAISFDRKGTQDILTHQCGTRCCSQVFAEVLGDDLGLIPSPHGAFTDTECLTGVVPECTNVSIGYALAHTQDESLDLVYLEKLIRKLVAYKGWGLLPIVREPADADPLYEWGAADEPLTDPLQLIYEDPEFVLEFLEAYNLTEVLLDEYQKEKENYGSY